jgi:hypothetical protein
MKHKPHSDIKTVGNYLSPAPQAEPQAVGFSAGLSDAPQAEPQAAGFSAGLSDAPQAVPQDEPVSTAFLLQAYKFESAIIYLSFRIIKSIVLLLVIIIIYIFYL